MRTRFVALIGAFLLVTIAKGSGYCGEETPGHFKWGADSALRLGEALALGSTLELSDRLEDHSSIPNLVGTTYVSGDYEWVKTDINNAVTSAIKGIPTSIALGPYSGPYSAVKNIITTWRLSQAETPKGFYEATRGDPLLGHLGIAARYFEDTNVRLHDFATSLDSPRTEGLRSLDFGTGVGSEIRNRLLGRGLGPEMQQKLFGTGADGWSEKLNRWNQWSTQTSLSSSNPLNNLDSPGLRLNSARMPKCVSVPNFSIDPTNPFGGGVFHAKYCVLLTPKRANRTLNVAATKQSATLNPKASYY